MMSPLKTGVLFLILSCVSACGDNLAAPRGDDDADAGGGDDQPDTPSVRSTLPVDGATLVAPATTISAIFTSPMDGASGEGAFAVRLGDVTVDGAVTYAAATRTATFVPADDLSLTALYTATITTAATDTSGVAMAADYDWTFETAASALPPTVTSTTPDDLAQDIAINERPTATFSNAMDPATLTEDTFTLAQAGNPVAGSVALDGLTNTATFTPDAPLETDLLYTATITTGVENTGAVAMLAPYVWTFQTDPCGLATIDLGSAAAFAVLAGSTVTSTGPTSVTGDLGVSPGTAVTGFGPGVLIGTQHAGDPTAAQAIADLTTAYNDAAARSLCATALSGDAGGQTLSPGLYHSGTSLEITTADLTLDAGGDNNAVFIFQMATTLTTSPGRKVILTGGANAANIYWQVGSSATLGTTTEFYGTIMADQAITLGTGASLGGRALARIAAVALDSKVIVLP
jgi:hypothetical protein